MAKTTLYSKDYTELTRDEHGEHFLSVVVGGIGQMLITIALTAEELGYYREYGDYYVEKLALDICRNPEKFQSRALKNAQ